MECDSNETIISQQDLSPTQVLADIRYHADKQSMLDPPTSILMIERQKVRSFVILCDKL